LATPRRNEAAGSGIPSEIEIGGIVRRIAILTTGLHPCACYVARRLRPSGVAVFLINQRRLSIEPDSPAFFRRLLSKRGFLITLDYLMFVVLKRSVLALTRRVHAPSSGEAAFSVPCMRPDSGIASEEWLRYVEVSDINRSPDRDRLQEIAPDLILLAGAPILFRGTIEAARVACINPHCGITPRYAGSSPYEWAAYERRFDDIGFTVHVVVPKVDSGPILWQERVAWDPRRPLRELSPLLAQKMYDKMIEIAEGMIAGRRYRATPQKVEPSKPPAGLTTRVLAELRRKGYARRKDVGSRLRAD
jgi:hypothetical protein